MAGELNVVSKRATSKTTLWHKRLAHISPRGLSCLFKQGLIGKSKPVEMSFCEHCILGKASKKSFTKASHTTETRLDYIHSDLWGSSRIATHGEARYFLTLIDDFSRKVWVYMLKTKDEVFGRFVEWKTMIENRTDKKIKYLRTDNGLEFLNERFSNPCKTCGISRHLTAAGNPQQNGLVERGEAVNTAVYLINRSPSTALNFKTPQEVWFGHPPNLKHLRVFGCAAYAHTRQDMLLPRAKKCIFLGYPQGVKAYKFWSLEPGENKCLISRDVFDEGLMSWKDKGIMESDKDADKESFEIEL